MDIQAISGRNWSLAGATLGEAVKTSANVGKSSENWKVYDDTGVSYVAGEEPVSEEALRRDDDLGNFISKAYGLS